MNHLVFSTFYQVWTLIFNLSVYKPVSLKELSSLLAAYRNVISAEIEQLHIRVSCRILNLINSFWWQYQKPCHDFIVEMKDSDQRIHLQCFIRTWDFQFIDNSGFKDCLCKHRRPWSDCTLCSLIRVFHVCICHLYISSWHHSFVLELEARWKC